MHNFSLNQEEMWKKNMVFIKVEKKGGYLINYYEIYKIIRTVKLNVVLSNFSYVNPALLFGKICAITKNIVWFHSLNEQTGALLMNIFIRISFLRLADVIIANSHHTKDELHQDFKISISKIKTIPFWSSINKDNIERSYKIVSKVLKIGCPERLVKN